MKTGQVFVSHTSDMARFPEARAFVQAALDAVARAGLAAVDMRYFAARDGKPADYCRQRVSECEVYAAVIGFRYGSLVPGEAVSYTELEFQAASDAGLPRLVFLLEENACPPDPGEADRGRAEEFRQRLRDSGLVVSTFRSADGLELRVYQALHELAGDRPPRPAKEPRIWNVPGRNADFTGRDGLLDRLHNELAGDGRAVVLARALYGLGGVGKTSVALEYAHRFKTDYDLVWWIPAEHPQQISLTLGELAGQLGLRTSDNAAEAAAAASEHLRRDTADRWLLIFDNAEDPKDLESFLPAGSGHIMITSRNQAWTRHALPLEVDVFTLEESVAHLLRHVPELDHADAERVAEALGNLPLAVEQASAWLAETGMPADLYLEWLAKPAVRALALSKPSDYATPVVATWNLSFERLKRRSPAAIRLLQLCAFFSPGPISMDLLYSDEMNESLLPFDETLSEKEMLGQVIRDISRFALVKVDQGSNSMQIHRLVQAVIRSQLSDEEQTEAKHEVHKILVGARPRQGETDDPANWSTYDSIWPHLGPSHAEKCEDPRARQLLIDWVRYQWKIGEFDEALQQARDLEELWTHRLGKDDLQTLHLQFHIANVLRSQGRFDDARGLDTYVLKRQRAVLGPDHLHALITANGLGADLHALGDFQEALALNQQAYESFTEYFGKDYPRTLVAAHNLACSLRLVGDCFAARRLDEETLRRQRQVLGLEHPNTLLSAMSLANDMRAAGQFRESVDLLHDTLKKYRAVLGDNLPETLRAAMSLAISLRKAGDQTEALDLSRKTYEQCKDRYGSNGPDTWSCALTLACDFAAAHDTAKALELGTDVRTAQQARLSADHPNTLVAANNVGCYLRCLGRLAEASRLTDDTLQAMRRRLGGNHPLTLSCSINLASCLGLSGELGTAMSIQRETTSRLTEALGADHPDTLVCQANLAVSLHMAGRRTEAEECRTRALDDFSRVLGPRHPDAVLLRSWQWINRDLEPQMI
jgi:tetratricopeptide (TPR) repeat protein